MDIVSSNFLTGDPRLIDQIVYELKSQGIFDQFRKECIADVDTKPAYQNLSQRVEGSVMSFLNKQKFTEDINKNQLREQLRKNITESGFLESGVERIVDQVVNPKINSVFLPKVEDVVYRFLGIERPNQEGLRPESKPNADDLLPNDLEAVSPESVHDHPGNSSVEKKVATIEEANDNSLNSSNTKTEEESPPFEPLEENTKLPIYEENENSVDSHLSGISGLASHDSTQSNDAFNQTETSQDITQNSINSEGNLSIITTGEDTKMEICDDEAMLEVNDALETTAEKTNEVSKENEEQLAAGDSRSAKVDFENITTEGNEDKIKLTDFLNEINSESSVNNKKTEEEKEINIKTDSKRMRDKPKSSRSDRDKKEDKDKTVRSTKSKDRDKSSSKQASSSKDKEKKECTNGKEEGNYKLLKKEDKEQDKTKDKTKIKDKERSDKSRERPEKTKDRERSEKEKSNKDRSNKEKSRLDKEKEKSESDKYKTSRDKDKSDKNKTEKEKRDRSISSKSAKEKSDSSKKDKYEEKPSKDKGSTSKDKASSVNKHKESSSKDKSSKDRSKSSSSSSKDKEKDKKDAKPSDKYRKADKAKSLSYDKSSSSSRKDKEKKVVDDHYSLKDKKNDRRSTDRDSNDGSGKMSRNGSFTETYSGSYKGSSKESSEVFSSGGGDSSNSDKIEEKSPENTEHTGNTDLSNIEGNLPIKYIKPKFASNIHEAMKLMRIRKQLAKLERENQLALINVPIIDEYHADLKVKNETGNSLEETNAEILTSPRKQNGKRITELQVRLQRTNYGNVATSNCIDEDIPILKSQDLSMENFEALEARLAQEMSNINDHMYGDEDDYYECSSVTVSHVKKLKTFEESEISSNHNGQEIMKNDQTAFDKHNEEIEEYKENSNVVNSQADIVKYVQEELCVATDQDVHIENNAEELTLNPTNALVGGEYQMAQQFNMVDDEFRGFTFEAQNHSLPIKIKKLITQLSQGINLTSENQSARISQDTQKASLALPVKHIDLLQNNVTLQDEVCDINEVFDVPQEDLFNGAKGTKKTFSQEIEVKQNGQVAKHQSPDKGGSPCYFFDKTDTTSEAHLTILNENIAKLEKSIEEQSLKIQNNIPKPKKRGRKRKTHSTENNNSIDSEYKPARKRKLLSDTISNHNRDNLCHTDVSSHQNFSLPLSPAESDKSGEHKKEPITVQPKRISRGLSNKRYSNEDLYKPRPILSCSSSRRRGARLDDRNS